MASFPRAKVDSSTQTDPPLPFTALLDRALDRVEATVPLNLSSITFYIRRHHLSRIEQLESLLSENFFFKFVLFRVGLKPQHVYSVLCLVLLYGCRQLYRRSVYLTTNLCAVAYPAYCSIRTINSEPIAPPRELGLEPTEYAPLTSSSSRHHRRRSSIYSSGASVRSGKRRSSRSLHRMNNSSSNNISVVEDSSLQDSNSYSSSQEDYDSRRSIASSWGRPSDYSNYSEDNLTTTSGSAIISMTVEEKMKQRMRRRWALFSQTRKDKATRQWLAYWSIYGTVQVIDTWSSFLLDWIPGYNLGKLLFLWWAQRRGATLVFDYFQPLIQSKSKDGREVARKTSIRSLNSEMSRQDRQGGSGGGGNGGNASASGSRPVSLQILPSTLAHQQQQQHQQYQQQQPQYQQQQFEQQFYANKGGSRRDTATFRELNQGRHRDDYEDDDEEEDDEDDDFHHHHQRQQLLQQQRQQKQQHHSHHQGSLDLLREGMTSSPHDSGSFAETSLFESAESVWSAPPVSTGILATVDDIGGLGASGVGLSSSSFSSSAARLHSNNATPTPMSVQEQYHLRQQLQLQQQQQQSLQKQLAMSTQGEEDSGNMGDVADNSLHSYAVASTHHWNPSSTPSTDL
ncbi:hypothetical protein BGZ96_003209 [Linnemannia gamsii]|uniref:Uncharacterized protein n=1 Tax=Linnemannia gamsii TaxID=64522 RepID=A0ABQ7K752_9FUNG|nr:hypothetical protein BGZ96_003209 [Linnemannia gamsii]